MCHIKNNMAMEKHKPTEYNEKQENKLNLQRKLHVIYFLFGQ
jgi:hypothetical protein